jgi:hypothetical protein
MGLWRDARVPFDQEHLTPEQRRAADAILVRIAAALMLLALILIVGIVG